MTWTPVASGGGGGTITTVQQGWIGAPLIGAVVKGQIPITVAPGVTLASGTLTFFPSSNVNAITTLNANTTGSGTIGTFDGTLLQNGGYTIQLDATSTTGVTQRSLTAVDVTGENKPGRVVLTVTDLKVPLAGIPINISRTYDSLVRGKVGDFGNGWSLSAGVDLQVDAFNNVSFTFNKQRITFNFVPQSSSGLFPWLLVPKYAPTPGFHGSLISDGCNALVQIQGNVVCFPGSATYQPTTFTYTDPAGRFYVIAANGRLKSIRDLNNNVVTFTAAGISSTVGGISVAFIRDGLGRIQQITDPNNQAYTYGYDTSGNLASVTFPGVANPASYTYFADHSLKNQSDPGSNTFIRTYYPDGRLQNVTDPMQNLTQYSYNVAGNTTTTINPDNGVVVQTNNSFGNPLSITDALGQTTTYTYDSSQNLLSRTNPLGKTTTYTYDANGFQTSATDPLGNSFSAIYNQFGEPTSRTDGAGNVQTIAYDTNFNPNKLTDSIGQLSAGTFDVMGNPLTQVDGNGQTTTLGYDVYGYLNKRTDALNQVTTYINDAMGRIQSTTDPRQMNTTTYTYDPLGNLKTVTEPLGKVTNYTYDANSNKITQKDALLRITSYSYDALNRLAKITYPDATNSTQQFTYDFRNNKLTEIDQLGRTKKYVYDLAGRLKSVTSAFGTSDAGTISYTYYADGRVQTITDERSQVVATNTYDAAGNLISVTDSLNKTTAYGYDADNRKASVTDANTNKTQYTYDARSRLKLITYPDQTTTGYMYDGVGNRTTVTDQGGLVTTKTYDLVSRLISVKDPAMQVTQYRYDLNGNLTKITDGAGHITTFQYDALNRRTVRTLPLLMQETLTYDAVGTVHTRQDFNGKTTTYTYDGLDRVLGRIPDPTLSQPSVTFTYTSTGQRLTMTDASGTTNYSQYDNRDRLITKVTPAGTVNYTYDAKGNVLTITSGNANGVSLTYTYDAMSRLATVVDNRLVAQGFTSGTTTYTTYDPVGNLQSFVYPNGVQTTNGYDTLNRLSQTGSVKGTTALTNYGYALYPAGNRKTVTELGGRTVSYGYDLDYRLNSEAITGDPGGKNGTIGYTFDPANNRATMTSTLSGIPAGSFSYDTNDRLTTDVYNANGDTTSSGGIANTFDFEDLMTGRGAVVLVNDGDGNRVSETVGGVVTKYLVDNLNPTGYPQVLDELVGGAVTRTYSYGSQRISEDQLVGSTWTPSFYVYDGHGNVRVLTNLAGTVTDTYQFDAFGNVITSTGTTPNNYLYSGERFDSAVGLYYLRARYYRPVTSRFWTADSFPGTIQDPPTLNKYTYASQNAVNRIDPTGRDDTFEYTADLQVVFKNHGLLHLITKGLELTQPEVEAYIEQLVREFIAEANVYPGAPFDIPFALSQLNNVPWAARVFIISNALLEVTTYFPINQP